MKTVITKGLSPKQKEEMELLFKSNAIFRNKLIEILEDKIKLIRKKNIIEDSYNNPNWALKQADSVGYERAMNEIISILI